MSNTNGRLKNKEQLCQELQNYKFTLNQPMIEYLNRLVNLDFSVVKGLISEEERLALSELKIYRDIAIYNIYHRASQLLKQSEIPSTFKDSGEYFVKVENEHVPIFEFDYIAPHLIGIEYHEGTLVGKIRLYQCMENEEMRKKEIDRIVRRIECLKYEKDTRWSDDLDSFFYNHLRLLNKIEECEQTLEKLRGNLTEVDKKKIEITHYFHELFLQDYGLSSTDFIEREPKRKLTELQKVYVKNMPNLQIVDTTNYL